MKKMILLSLLVIFIIACNKENDAPGHESGEHNHSEMKANESAHNHDHEADERSHGEDAHNHEGQEHSHGEETHNHDGHVQYEGDGHNHDAENGPSHEENDDEHNHEINSNHGEEAEHQHQDEHAHEDGAENPNIVKMDLKELKKMEFEARAVHVSDFSNIVKTSGVVLPSQQNEKMVSATSSGVVKFRKKELRNGMTIRTGELLFSISGSGLKNENIEYRISSAEAELATSEKDFQRIEKLWQNKLITEKEYLNAKLSKENCELNLKKLSTNYIGSAINVYSSGKGYVTNVVVSDGQYVSEGAPLLSISNDNKLVIKAEMSQRQYSKIPRVYSANFTPEYSDTSYNLLDLKGRVLSVGRNFGADKYSIPVYLEIANTINLLPGSYLEIYLIGEPKKQALVIPKSSVIEKGNNYIAYVQTKPGSFEKRFLTFDGFDGENYSVSSGIHPGETVVTKGVYRIMLASNKNAAPTHGHVH